MADFTIEETEHISLCETLDRILNKGAVILGEVVISVANVDLIYIALQVMIGSVETVRESMLQCDHAPSIMKSGVRGSAGANVSLSEN